MSVVPTLNYIEFAVKDMAQAKTFLASAFGWQFTDYGPDTANSQIASKKVAFLLVPMCDQAYNDCVKARKNGCRQAQVTGGTITKGL